MTLECEDSHLPCLFLDGLFSDDSARMRTRTRTRSEKAKRSRRARMPVSNLLQLCSLQQTTPSVRGLPAFPEPSACVAVVGSSVFHLVCSPLSLQCQDFAQVYLRFPAFSLPTLLCHFRAVQFSRSVVSDSLRPHESQHARPPCPTPTPGVHPDSNPSSR